MSLHEFLAFLLLGAGAWFLWASLQEREAAVEAGRAACAAEDLLFLDDTVAIESVWPVRDDEGRVRMRRVYGFEYSDTGNNRQKGTVTLLGSQVIALRLAPPRPARETRMWY